MKQTKEAVVLLGQCLRPGPCWYLADLAGNFRLPKIWWKSHLTVWPHQRSKNWGFYCLQEPQNQSILCYGEGQALLARLASLQHPETAKGWMNRFLGMLKLSCFTKVLERSAAGSRLQGVAISWMQQKKIPKSCYSYNIPFWQDSVSPFLRAICVDL